MDNQEQERRKFQRYPFKEEILIDGTANAYSLNISETGMFVCTLHPLESGTIVNLTIASKFTVKAEVNHYQPGIGMGIEFIDLNHEQKIIIKSLIEGIRLKASEHYKL